MIVVLSILSPVAITGKRIYGHEQPALNARSNFALRVIKQDTALPLEVYSDRVKGQGFLIVD